MLSRQSHQKVLVSCEFKKSEKCSGEYYLQYRDYCNNLDRNNGKNICCHCSRVVKYTGRNNPNCKFKNLQDDYFKVVDTWEKAYLLGWIASDGSISSGVWAISISLHKQDIDVLEYLQQLLSVGEIKGKNDERMRYITINSKQICLDVCRLLHIKRGKKSHTVKFPHSIPKELYRAFIQGYFEGDGTLTGIYCKRKSLRVGIASSSLSMLESIKTIVGLKCYSHAHNGCNSIEYSDKRAFEFLDYIYNHSHFKMARKYNLYKIWLTFEKMPASCKIRSLNLNQKIKVCKTNLKAVLPSKAHDGDAGYDLHIIEKVKDINSNTALYSTGLKFQFFEAGWYLALYARSSLIKSGYILTNSVGIIDGGFMGTVLVSLTKVNAESSDIQLPAKIAQIIPQQLHTLDIHEVSEDNFLQTSRGDGGFGSSDAKVQSKMQTL